MGRVISRRSSVVVVLSDKLELMVVSAVAGPSGLVSACPLFFGLRIPRVRGQPHGFSISTRLYFPRPPSWTASHPCCTWWRRSTFSLFSPAPLFTNICLRLVWSFVIPGGQTPCHWPIISSSYGSSLDEQNPLYDILSNGRCLTDGGFSSRRRIRQA